MTQYVSAPRATEVERRLEELKNQPQDIVRSEFDKILKKPVKETLSPNLKPNQEFINAFNKRKAEEDQNKQKDEFLDSIDNQGYKLEKIYLNKHYQKIHDPLQLYAHYENYDDLAWKVYQDIDDNNTYLKALYYPNLRTEDYHDLISRFSESYKYTGFNNRFAFLVGVGSGIGGFLLSNKFRLTARSTIFSTLALSFTGFYLYNENAKKTLRSRLNSYALEKVIPKYPEIKITQLQYKSLNH